MEERRKPDDGNASKLAKPLMELGSKIGNSLGVGANALSLHCSDRPQSMHL